ncbi:hypothetical protein [Streptomyces sp. NPDC048277]|uniref:hypothetical protein n=1 Tax=Streptomyces sp. NPDC048277 TaxID=3155027 RepID=UPI0034028286
MTARRPSRVAAGSTAALLCALLTACAAPAPAASSAAGGTTSPATGAVKTLPPSRLCTVLTADVAGRLVTDARRTTQVSPNKGDAPDVCGYVAADGTSTLSLTPASRAYPAELSAAHDLSAHPAPAGMRDVRVTAAGDLGAQAFRETAYQVQTRQHLTFVVWNPGPRTWVLTFATAAATAADDEVVRVARSITAKLPAG